MDIVYPAMFQHLNADGELATYVADVSQRNNPDDPKGLTAPIVSIQAFAAPDVDGLHGAAVDMTIEIKVWAYGNKMLKDAMRAARRISELLLQDIALGDSSFLGKFRPITGWQDIDTADPRTIHLQNQYAARYWSAGKIAALTT